MHSADADAHDPTKRRSHNLPLNIDYVTKQPAPRELLVSLL